jgi:hypothetical protein
MHYDITKVRWIEIKIDKELGRDRRCDNRERKGERLMELRNVGK